MCDMARRTQPLARIWEPLLRPFSTACPVPQVSQALGGQLRWYALDVQASTAPPPLCMACADIAGRNVS